MYRVTCKQCGGSGITDNGLRLQSAVSCPCCPLPHDHDEAANGCPGAGVDDLAQQHPDVACAAGSVSCNAITPLGEECPGGHCYPGTPGCTVCRPVTADWLGIMPLAGVVS